MKRRKRSTAQWLTSRNTGRQFSDRNSASSISTMMTLLLQYLTIPMKKLAVLYDFVMVDKQPFDGRIYFLQYNNDNGMIGFTRVNMRVLRTCLRMPLHK